MLCAPGLSSPGFVGGQSSGEPAGAHLPRSAAQAASWPPQALLAEPAPPAASAAPVGAPGSLGLARVGQGLTNPAAGVPLMPAPVLAGPQARLVPLRQSSLPAWSTVAPPPRPLQSTPPALPGGSVFGAAAAADDVLSSLLAMLQQEPAEGSNPQPGPDPNPAAAARAPAALARQAAPCAAPALAPARQAAGAGAPRGYSPPSSLAGPLAPAQVPAVQGGNQAAPWGRSCKQGSASAVLPPAAQPSHRGNAAHQCQKSESESACAGNPPPAAHALTGVDLAAPLGLRTSKAGARAGGGRQPMGAYPRPPPHLWPGGTSVALAGLAPVGAPAALRLAGDRPQQQPGRGACAGHPQRLPAPGASSAPAGRSTPDPTPKFAIDLREVAPSVMQLWPMPATGPVLNPTHPTSNSHWFPACCFAFACCSCFAVSAVPALIQFVM